KIIQKINAIHPSAPGSNSALINSITTVSAKGVSVNAKFTALRKLKIEGGHALMLVADNTFANQLITSFGKRYEAMGGNDTSETLTEDDKASSYAFINNSGTKGEKDTMLALSINNIADTFRWGEPNKKPDGMVWLQHRTTLQKLYPHVLRDHVFETVKDYTLSSIYFLG